MRTTITKVALLALALPLLGAGSATEVSIPLKNIHYDVTFTRETAKERKLRVAMEFDVAAAGNVVLSLPSWTPGAYEISNYARDVVDFVPTLGDHELRWDKLDYDTWRVRATKAGHIKVSFDYLADSLDNAHSWSKDDFAFFNGTNIFLYPEGASKLFAATVQIHTDSDWRVATGMHPIAGGGFSERNYHDLVDMPFFVGHFDIDSNQVGPVLARLASYPAGTLTGKARTDFWAQYRTLFAPEAAVFGETPYQNYTTFMVFDSSYNGGSALEHQNSHLGIYTPLGIGQIWVASVTAHEMFHAFNVKRLRPAEMVPYRYDAAEPTPWLWVSEGITDYYADLTLLRAGLVDSLAFLTTTGGKMQEVDAAPPTALADASLTTWIHPTDGSEDIYYPKGSLAGFILDIMIRDASDNHESLDQVMRKMYQTTFKLGKGFTGLEWWGAVRAAAGGKDFATFNSKYITGREEFPWESVLPLAGLKVAIDSAMVPRLGVNLDPSGTRIIAVTPTGAAASAGIQVGDSLLAVGNITVHDLTSLDQFRQQFGKAAEGSDLPIRVKRKGQELVLQAKVRLALVTQPRLAIDPNASAKAVRVRHGLFTGETK